MGFVSLRKWEFHLSSEIHINIKGCYGFMNTFLLAPGFGCNSFLICSIEINIPSLVTDALVVFHKVLVTIRCILNSFILL